MKNNKPEDEDTFAAADRFKKAFEKREAGIKLQEKKLVEAESKIAKLTQDLEQAKLEVKVAKNLWLSERSENIRVCNNLEYERGAHQHTKRLLQEAIAEKDDAKFEAQLGKVASNALKEIGKMLGWQDFDHPNRNPKFNDCGGIPGLVKELIKEHNKLKKQLKKGKNE